MISDRIFKVEKLTDLKSQAAWKALLNNLGKGDVYLTPEYVLSTRFLDEGEVFVASLAGDEGEAVIYPFYRRRIPPPDSNSGLAGDYYDITTPYGYSGPLLTSPEKINTQFFKYFTEWCRDNRVITEFIRYNPFLENHRPTAAVTKTEIRSRIVYVDLARPLQEITDGFSSHHRRNLKNALKNNLAFREVNPENRLEAFISLYYQTMKKVEAKPFYFFPKEYFYSLKALMGPGFHLFAVDSDGVPVAMAICLSHHHRLHYHLGASDDRYLKLRPNNYLFYGIIQWAQARGFRIFNLGGGVTLDDALFSFKRGFSGHVLDFYCGKTVFDQKTYARLNEAARKSGNHKRESFYARTYFPIYRSQP